MSVPSHTCTLCTHVCTFLPPRKDFCMKPWQYYIVINTEFAACLQQEVFRSTSCCKHAANWVLAATLNVPSFTFLCSHLQRPEIRIYVLNMYAQHARRVLCAVSYLTNRNLDQENMMTWFVLQKEEEEYVTVNNSKQANLSHVLNIECDLQLDNALLPL